MANFLQEDFGGGIYRGRKAPANSVFDASNALVDDEGQLFRRGGSAFWSTSNAGSALLRIAAPYLPAAKANRVFAWGSTLYTFNGSNAPVSVLAPGATMGRPTVIAGMIVWPVSRNQLLWHAGSLLSSAYSVGTITATHGNTAVTGSGTTWLTNIDAGQFLRTSGPPAQPIVSVNSNTSLTLLEPWRGATVAGEPYSIDSYYGPSSPLTLPGGSGSSFVIAIPTARKLLMTVDNKVFMSTGSATPLSDPLADPLSEGALGGGWNINLFHEIPSGSTIIGGDALGTTAIIFTTRGLWSINNLELDVVDDYGNIQQQVREVNKDLILWGDLGIANWVGGLVAPCLDDVYLLGADQQPHTISQNIRPLYRSYIAAGYTPGQAAAHRGHYFLPILNGSTLVDVLICRIDRRPAWTRWAGHAAGAGYTRLVSDSGAPKLLGLASQRVTDLTTCLNAVGNASDADGTTHTFTKDSNDLDLGPGIRPDTAEKVRYVYETAGGTPTITVSHAVGAEGASYTAATLKRGGGVSDGTDYSAWRVGRKAERIRFRFTTSSAVTSLILRRMEVTIRQAGQT